MKKFYKLSFHASDDVAISETMPELLSLASRSVAPTSDEVRAQLDEWNDETAARYYAESALAGADSEALATLVAPERAAVVPDLRVVESKESSLTGTCCRARLLFVREVVIFPLNRVTNPVCQVI